MKTSTYKGVTRYGDKWRAQISIFGKARLIGSFETEREAAKAFDNAAFGLNKVRPEKVKLNFDDDYYSGEHSAPELTERSEQLVKMYLESGAPRNLSVLGVLEIRTLREALRKVFDSDATRQARLSAEARELDSRLDRLAECLHFLGDKSPFEDRKRQAMGNTQSVTSNQSNASTGEVASSQAVTQTATTQGGTSTWKCPGLKGCDKPCSCQPYTETQ